MASVWGYIVIEEVPVEIYKEMINAISNGIMFVRPDGKIILANTAMAEISGYTCSDLLQSTCRILNCDV